jgi:hypothetical protein
LSIDLVAKVGGFVRGMTQAERQAEKSAKAINQRMRKLGSDLGKAFAASSVAIATVGAVVLRNTIEAERVQAQLAAALKSTGGAAGLTQAQLNGMAGELQRVTTFGDEAINSAQALLLTFTKIGGDVFPKAIEAAANMATALGTDLQSATTQLGKALNDPIRGVTALGRAGVQFSADQKAMIASLVETGRTAEAQRLILAELETQFGGSAVAARDTLGGALEGLRNAFGDLLEGDSGGEGIKGTKAALESFTATLQSEDTKRGFQSLISLLAETLEFGAKTAAMFGDLTAKIQSAGKAQSERDRGELVDRQIQLEKQIELLEKSGVGAGLLSAFTAFPGVDLDPFASRADNLERLKGELADTIERMDQLTIAENKLRAAAESGGSSGSPNGRGRGVQVTLASPESGSSGGARAAGVSSGASFDQAASAAAAAARDAAAAQDEFRRATEALRAELGGPMADVTLEYVRREDEIVKLAQLAGLSNEELAESLNLLEAARQRDLKALGDQAAAQQAYAEAMQDQPLVDQLNMVRETSASFFRDLFKNGKDAIDNLQDYLVDIAFDSIAKQLTEGLLGDYGTKGNGGGFLSFLGSLFGGARAGGGPVYPGKAYLVGEEGPELIRPMGAGMVSTAAQTARMGAGGGSVVNNFNLPGRYDMRTQSQIAVDVQRGNERAVRRGTA